MRNNPGLCRASGAPPCLWGATPLGRDHSTLAPPEKRLSNVQNQEKKKLNIHDDAFKDAAGLLQASDVNVYMHNVALSSA